MKFGVSNQNPIVGDLFIHEVVSTTFGDGTTESLLKTKIYFSFAGENNSAQALVDGGSTHSFIAPQSLTSNQLKFIANNKSKLEQRLFIINSATGIVKEHCFIINLRIKIDAWSGEMSFILCKQIDKHAIVLGRDFLKQKKAIIDHGMDMLRIDNVAIRIGNDQDEMSDLEIEEEQNEMSLYDAILPYKHFDIISYLGHTLLDVLKCIRFKFA